MRLKCGASTLGKGRVASQSGTNSITSYGNERISFGAAFDLQQILLDLDGADLLLVGMEAAEHTSFDVGLAIRQASADPVFQVRANARLAMLGSSQTLQVCWFGE